MLPPISGGAPEPDEPKGARPEPGPSRASAGRRHRRHDGGRSAARPAASDEPSQPGRIPVGERTGRDRRPFPRAGRLGAGAEAASRDRPGCRRHARTARPRAVSAEAIAHDQAESGPVEPADEPAATGDHLPDPGAAERAEGGARRGSTAESTRPPRRPPARTVPRRTDGPGVRPASAPGEASRPGAQESSRGRGSRGRQSSAAPATVAAPSRTPPMPSSPSSPTSSSTRPAPASTPPARSAATSCPNSTPRSAARSRSADGCRIRSPSW